MRHSRVGRTKAMPELVKLEDNLNSVTDYQNLSQIESLNHDIYTTLLGKKLGAGSYRSVYEYNINPDFVIKLEPLNTGCNFVEWMMWNQIQHLTGNLAWVKDWFAPVKWISPNNRILLMEKTVQKPGKKKPAKVPKFLWDVKDSNFGWIGNKFVIHDYGQFYNFIDFKKGMKPAVWYE